MTYYQARRILRERHKERPLPKYPEGWWVGPGLLVAILAVGLAVILL